MRTDRLFRKNRTTGIAAMVLTVAVLCLLTVPNTVSNAWADDWGYGTGPWDRRGPVLVDPGGRVFLRIPLPPPPGYYYRKRWREHDREIAELERIANDDNF